LREAGGRQFHRDGPITVKDLDLITVVLTQRAKRFPPYLKSKEDVKM